MKWDKVSENTAELSEKEAWFDPELMTIPDERMQERFPNMTFVGPEPAQPPSC